MSGDHEDQQSQNESPPETTYCSSVQSTLEGDRGTGLWDASMRSFPPITMNTAYGETEAARSVANDVNTASQDQSRGSDEVDGPFSDNIMSEGTASSGRGLRMGAGIQWTHEDPFGNYPITVPKDEGYESEPDVADGIGPFDEVDG
jgi:hypothetical protein